jgi:hypothetical protein
MADKALAKTAAGFKAGGRHSGARTFVREPGIQSNTATLSLWPWIPSPPLRGVPE